MPVGQLMGLLESRGLAAPFAPGAAITVKRQDGSTIPIRVGPEEPLQHLEDRIAQQEVRVPSCADRDSGGGVRTSLGSGPWP